jgi:hypothetical protein
MAFLAPAFGELVLDATEATAGSGFLSNMFHHFEEPLKNLAINEIGKLTGEYARSHQGGLIDQAITSANNYRIKKTKTNRQVRKLSR